MKVSRQIVLMVVAAWTFAVGCDKADQYIADWESNPAAVRINASVETITKTNPLGTVEEQSKFSVGDKISVIHTSANKLVNYVYDGSSWAPEGEDYLTWQIDATNIFRLQYPYIGHEGDFGEFFKDQSTLEKMCRSDLMKSEDIKYTKIPDDRRLRASLVRQRSLVTVVIAKFGDEFSSEDAKVSDLKLHLWDGGQGEEIISVTPYIRDAQGAAQQAGSAGLVGYSYTAIGRNDCKYRGNAFITMTVAGKTLTVPNPQDMVNGKHYTYKLVVGKESVKIGGVVVEEWASGGKIDGVFEAESGEYNEWDGQKVIGTYYFSGSGTSENPYLIESATDLAALAANVNGGEGYQGKCFRLETNIDLMGHEWTPIGNRRNYFNGDFDGNGKVITNLTISDVTGCAGLFGVSRGSIRNVVLKSASVSSLGNGTVALLVGDAGGSIELCKLEGKVSSQEYVAAGIAGSCSGLVISDCEINIDCSSGYLSGGIFGQMSGDYALTIKSCVVRGHISAKSCFGGIAGSLQGSNVLVSGCKSYATLSQVDKANAPVVGGIAGAVYSGCRFEDCDVYGDINIESENSANSPKVGGMIGHASQATISNLKFAGTMNVKSKKEENKIGAIIGVVEKSLNVSSDCTYRKSGTGTLPPVGTYPDGVDISRIKGI